MSSGEGEVAILRLPSLLDVSDVVGVGQHTGIASLATVMSLEEGGQRIFISPPDVHPLIIALENQLLCDEVL